MQEFTRKAGNKRNQDFVCAGNFLVLPVFYSYSGNIAILDATITYSPEYANSLLCRIGAEGRSFYINEIIFFDFIFPVIVFLFYSSFFLFLLKKINSSFRIILVVNGLALFTDFAENIFLIATICEFPNTYPLIINTANILTIMKTICGFMILIILLIPLIILFYKKVLKKENNP
jgi:hypothetical protein